MDLSHLRIHFSLEFGYFARIFSISLFFLYYIFLFVFFLCLFILKIEVPLIYNVAPVSAVEQLLFSFTHIYIPFLKYSFPLWLIQEIRYKSCAMHRTLLLIRPKCDGLHLPTPNSQPIPLSPPHLYISLLHPVPFTLLMVEKIL